MTDKAKYFDKAAKDVLKLKECSDENKLKLYGLYKQANVGDCNTAKPGLFAVKGKDKEVAKAEYVELVLSLLPDDLKKDYN